MIRRLVILAAALGLCSAMPAAAQPDYNETGWRPATEHEKALRKAYEDGKFTWSKDDGIDEMYDCMIAWQVWAITARVAPDTFPTISGDLSHVFAEGHMSHYVNTLYEKAGGDVEVFVQNMIAAAQRIERTVPLNDEKALYRYMGKCYVQPASWNFSQGVRMTGPEFARDFLQRAEVGDDYPVYVKDIAKRKVFDKLVLEKRFPEAANFAAKMHADPALKSTVYWHEILELSEMAVSAGRGSDLSMPLLDTLSKVWWPKYKRGWAVNAMRVKRGENPANDHRPKSSGVGKEPGWAKQERERYYGGRTNYTPCNQWNKMGC
ncbi:hypothetical protein [Erythrobacter sp.]|uniref:hypothetical protein n=1 Tax=Erythrobacter sp. TaxID=1042 RepID=UPI001425CEB8|nr:hypothetical protein [Erythrobacter sp.]QIQ87508.1 MAG: hypothetical protein G9473_13065 [Erythrobacter sp.]